MKTGDGASGRRCVRRILQRSNLTEENYAEIWHSNIIIMQRVYDYVTWSRISVVCSVSAVL